MLFIDNKVSLNFEEYSNCLNKAEAFHGHLCPGMFNGVKMSLLAQRLLGYSTDQSSDLIVVAEIDRCLTDAIMSVTGCRVGLRSLKLLDFGKFAATFCSIERKQGIRLALLESATTALENQLQEQGIEKNSPAAAKLFFDHPWQKQFSAVVLDMKWDENELPGLPREKHACPICRESILDGRHVVRGEAICCRPCSDLLNKEK